MPAASGGVNATPSLAARSRATPTYDQQSGRLRVDVDVEDDVVAQPGDVAVGHAERGVGGQHEDAAVVVAEAELARRAEHPLGLDAEDAAPGDRAPVGHRRAERGQRHDVAGVRS